MKILRCLVFVGLACFTVEMVSGKEAVDTELKKIILSVEDYKNDRVSYTAHYSGFTRDAPPFLQKDFKEGRDIILRVGGPQLPVIAEQSDVESIIEKLRAGAVVKVTGKVREARIQSRAARTSDYFLELTGLEVVKEAPSVSEGAKLKRHANAAKKRAGTVTQ